MLRVSWISQVTNHDSVFRRGSEYFGPLHVYTKLMVQFGRRMDTRRLLQVQTKGNHDNVVYAQGYDRHLLTEDSTYKGFIVYISVPVCP